MNKPIVFMFSGQGSQYYQMGKELYESHPRFKLWMDHCADIVDPLVTPFSMIDELYKNNSKSDPFDQLLLSNPALISIEYSLAQILTEMGIVPDYLIGYSLGEITACIISGVMSLEDGLKLSVNIANLLEKEAEEGAMLAVIDKLDLINQYPEWFQGCTVTGINFKNNFVVSGKAQSIDTLQGKLNSHKYMSQKLAVKYGFHTPLMEPFEERIKNVIREFNLYQARIPLVSSSSHELIKDVDEEYLWQVIRNPVEFSKTISFLEKKLSSCFIDVGPSGSLATFVKYLLPTNSSSEYFEIMNQFGKNNQSLEKFKSTFLSTVNN